MILIESLYAFCIACFAGLCASCTFFTNGTWLQYSAVVLGCTMTGLLHGALRRYGKISVLTVLCAYVPLLLMQDIDGYTLVILPAFFLTVSAWKEFYPQHDSFGTFFTAGLGICLFLSLVSLVLDKGLVKLPLFYLFAASGTALLRTLRLPGSEMNFFFQRNSVLSLTAAALVMSILSMSVIWETLLKGVKWFYFHVIVVIIYVIAWGVSWIMKGVLWVLAQIFGDLYFDPEIFDLSTDLLDGSGFDSGEAVTFYDFAYVNELRILVMILVLGGIAAYVIYRVKHMKPRAAYDTGKVEYIREKEKKKEKVTGARGSIRRTYKKYLADLMRKGIHREAGTTSKEILDYSVQGMHAPEEESEELRSLYLSARYDMKREPTEKDADHAKTLWKNLKKTVE